MREINYQPVNSDGSVPNYLPGNEPENIKKRMDTLFAKLDTAYPDYVIRGLHSDHKKWAETVTDLYRLLGYTSGNEFLQTYGYTIEIGKGGRTSSYSAEQLIEELQRRYPNGSEYTGLAELRDANLDLAGKFKTIGNKANETLGMPLGKYLITIGILSSKTPQSEINHDVVIEELQRRYPDGSGLASKKELITVNPDLKSKLDDISTKELVEIGILLEGKIAREQAKMAERKKLLADYGYDIVNGVFIENNFHEMRANNQTEYQSKIDAIVDKLNIKLKKYKASKLPDSIVELAELCSDIPVYDLCHYLFVMTGENPEWYLRKRGLLRNTLYEDKKNLANRIEILKKDGNTSFADYYSSEYFEMKNDIATIISLGYEPNRYVREQGAFLPEVSLAEETPDDHFIGILLDGEKTDTIRFPKKNDEVYTLYTVSDDKKEIVFSSYVGIKSEKSDDYFKDIPVNLFAEGAYLHDDDKISFYEKDGTYLGEFPSGAYNAIICGEYIVKDAKILGVIDDDCQEAGYKTVALRYVLVKAIDLNESFDNGNIVKGNEVEVDNKRLKSGYKTHSKKGDYDKQFGNCMFRGVASEVNKAALIAVENGVYIEKKKTKDQGIYEFILEGEDDSELIDILLAKVPCLKMIGFFVTDVVGSAVEIVLSEPGYPGITSVEDAAKKFYPEYDSPWFFVNLPNKDFRKRYTFMDYTSSMRGETTIDYAFPYKKEWNTYDYCYEADGKIYRVESVNDELPKRDPNNSYNISPEYFMNSDMEYYDIPENIRVIGQAAFKNCKKLKKITIPSSVKIIGADAFYGCTALEEVIISDGVEQIDVCAFWGCSALKDITLPNSIKSIGGFAFASCESLKKAVLPENTTILRQGLFLNCYQLKEVVLTNEPKIIEDYAFCNCELLHSQYIDGEDRSVSIGSQHYCNEHIYTNTPIAEFSNLLKQNVISGLVEALLAGETVDEESFEINRKYINNQKSRYLDMILTSEHLLRFMMGQQIIPKDLAETLIEKLGISTELSEVIKTYSRIFLS